MLARHEARLKDEPSVAPRSLTRTSLPRRLGEGRDGGTALLTEQRNHHFAEGVFLDGCALHLKFRFKGNAGQQ